MFRQATINIRKPLGNGEYSSSGFPIIFRQPYNNIGLAMRFNFSKTFFAPFASCNLSIENPNSFLTEQFNFDIENYTERPLVEIRAGYTEKRIFSILDFESLNRELQLIYSGFPNYISDPRHINGRTLNVTLNDLSLVDVQGQGAKVSEQFQANTRVLELLSILLQRCNIQADISRLQADSRLANAVIGTDIWYNNRVFTTDILNNLKKEYGFYCNINPSGTYIFYPAGVQKIGSVTRVDNTNGLIEYPTKVNWTHYAANTLFASPRLFYPGDWMQVFSEQLIEDKISNTGILSGVVTVGNYNFDDNVASCSYIIAPEGIPVESRPVFVI